MLLSGIGRRVTADDLHTHGKIALKDEKTHGLERVVREFPAIGETQTYYAPKEVAKEYRDRWAAEKTRAEARAAEAAPGRTWGEFLGETGAKVSDAARAAGRTVAETTAEGLRAAKATGTKAVEGVKDIVQGPPQRMTLKNQEQVNKFFRQYRQSHRRRWGHLWGAIYLLGPWGNPHKRAEKSEQKYRQVRDRPKLAPRTTVLVVDDGTLTAGDKRWLHKIVVERCKGTLESS